MTKIKTFDMLTDREQADIFKVMVPLAQTDGKITLSELVNLSGKLESRIRSLEGKIDFFQILSGGDVIMLTPGRTWAIDRCLIEGEQKDTPAPYPGTDGTYLADSTSGGAKNRFPIRFQMGSEEANKAAAEGNLSKPELLFLVAPELAKSYVGDNKAKVDLFLACLGSKLPKEYRKSIKFCVPFETSEFTDNYYCSRCRDTVKSSHFKKG